MLLEIRVRVRLRVRAVPYHFMANRWGNNGNSERLYFWGAPKSLQMVTAAAAKSLQSCPTPCDPTDGSPQHERHGPPGTMTSQLS